MAPRKEKGQKAKTKQQRGYIYKDSTKRVQSLYYGEMIIVGMNR